MKHESQLISGNLYKILSAFKKGLDHVWGALLKYSGIADALIPVSVLKPGDWGAVDVASIVAMIGLCAALVVIQCMIEVSL